MRLYEIANSYDYLMTAIENGEIPEEAISDTLEAITAELEDKADNIACLLKNLDAEILAIKAEENRLAERRKTKERQYERIKEYLAETLQNANIEKVETARNRITFRKSEAVEVVDHDTFFEWAVNNRSDLLTHLAPKENKTEIKKALKSGVEIPGAVLVTNQNIQLN